MTAFNYGNNVAASFAYSADWLQLASLSYTEPGAPTPFFSLSYCHWQNCDTQSGGNNGQAFQQVRNTGM